MSLPDAFLRPIAHRGLHGPDRPENSIEAFRAAVARGYAIELDVQLSGDGVAMAFHDATLDRMTDGEGPVDALDAQALSWLPLRGGATGMPRLADVLAAVAGAVPVVVEIKGRDHALGPDIGPLEDATMAALEGYGGDVAVMAFNPHSVARCAERAPDVPRGLVTGPFRAEDWPDLPAATRERLAGIPDHDPLGCAFVSHQADALDMPRIAELRAAGSSILCWTIRTPEQAALARRVADAVTFEGYLP